MLKELIMLIELIVEERRKEKEFITFFRVVCFDRNVGKYLCFEFGMHFMRQYWISGVLQQSGICIERGIL